MSPSELAGERASSPRRAPADLATSMRAVRTQDMERLCYRSARIRDRSRRAGSARDRLRADGAGHLIRVCGGSILSDETDARTDPPITPPTTPGPLRLPPRSSNWPRVIGIIAIVVGSCGILVGISGSFTLPIVRWSTSMSPPGQNVGLENLEQHSTWFVLTSILSSAVALFLLPAGICLLGRRRAAVNLCRFWALTKIMYVVFNSIVAAAIQQEQFAAMQGTAGLPGWFFGVTGGFTILVGLIWGWALPVFLLVWFSRKNVRAEVAGWA